MTGASFRALTAGLPRVTDEAGAARAVAELEARAASSDDPTLLDWVREALAATDSRPLFDAVFSNSPFLTDCALAEPAFLRRLWRDGPDTVFAQVVAHLKDDVGREADPDRVKRELRIARRRVALLVALADLTGHWRLDQVTHALADFADTALSTALSHLLLGAAETGDLALADADFPEDDCGFVALAMGKHGARELNYSSDIDLIVLYEPMKADYRGRRSPQQLFIRMTQRLVALLQERTADGYVCRVDLRLRPDPASTPVAIPCAAARAYYADRGENWERAAMIKARPAAGDIALGRAFLEEIGSFVWRERLDFWTAREVGAIKRRINAQRGGGQVAVLGHNVKLGRGGIREIEFFAQTQQLIFGGRDSYLRCPRTVEALSTLAEAGRIEESAADELTEAYEFLRQLEHRLQMVDDKQTQTLPADEADMDRIAGFMGFEELEPFRELFLHHLRRVEAHFSAFFDGPGTPGDEADVDLSGTASDDESALAQSACRLRSADFRATRDVRSRALLDELIPRLVERAARRSDPERVLAGFEDFLAGLPKGVQCLALLAANDGLFDLLVEIVDLAPALAKNLAARPEQLQAVLSEGFFGLPPDRRLLAAESAEVLRGARDPQDFLERAVLWTNDQRFQVAANVLRFALDSADAGHALGDIADVALRNLARRLGEDSASASESGLVVVALGAFGARELTFRSRLSLLFVHDGGPEAAGTHARLARRLVSLLGAETAVGRLYEVDPGGSEWGLPGPLVTSFESFQAYCTQTPETRHLLAFCRARSIVGPAPLVHRVDAALGRLLCEDHDVRAVAAGARTARREARAVEGRGARWAVRQRPGGLDDLDSLTRVLQLRHARAQPDVLEPSAAVALAKLGAKDLIEKPLAKELIDAHHLLRQIETLLAVALDAPPADDETLSDGLKTALTRACGAADFAALVARLDGACARTELIFDRYLSEIL